MTAAFARRLRRVLRSSSVHFLAIGAVLFGLERVWSQLAPAPSSQATIVLTAEYVARLRRAWTDERGRAPDAAEERRIIAAAVDDEILHREALAVGLDRDDRAVRSRLVQLAGGLALAPGADRSRLEEQARALGMAQSDPVIASHLAGMMRLALARTAPSDMPSEEELARYFERHAASFAQAARVRLTHVYFKRDAGEEAALRLRALPPSAAGLGDPFIHGADIGPVSPAELSRLFGGDFGAAVEAAPLRDWTGPLRSAYGLHLVWVHERIAARIPSLDSVRTRVVHAFLHERAAARLRERMTAVRARYRIELRG